jgi:hypothetical protein
MIFSILILFTASLSVFSQDLEVLCSKALLTEMQKQKLISNSSGVCVQSLNDLPQVTIGLGSSVYSSGVATGKSLGNEDEKIKTISEILTEDSLNKFKFEVHGYADGENNTISSYTDKFLGSKTTFTKADIRLQIKDSHTRSKVLELLNDVDEKTPIVPVRSPTSGASFKHDPGVFYPKNIDRVMSLINNYYLAFDRGVKTCLQLAQKTNATETDALNNCEKKVSGYASPNSEVVSSGRIHCDARRKAVLILNPGEKAKMSTNPSLVQPNFSIPGEGESRRDMQISASLDLMKKIMEEGGEVNARSTIEKLATACSNYQLGDGYQLNKQNLERMYEDIYKLNSTNPSPELKKAITNGDYSKVKRLLFSGDDQDELNKKLANALTYGRDKDELLNRLKVYKGGKELKCNKHYYKDASGNNAVHRVTVYRTVEGYKNKSSSDYEVMDCGGIYLVQNFNPYNKSQVLLVNPGSNNKFSYAKDQNGNPIPTEGYKLIDPKYPLASRETSSTDVFNCLSASKAIEEKLMESNQTGGGGQLIDPTELFPKDGSIKVSIDTESIGKFTSKDNKTIQGWMCHQCKSGLHVNTNASNEKTIERQSREYVNTSASEQSTKSAPIEKMGLTFGSMRNLAFRKVTRDSFSGKCPTSKSVCDCLRNVSNYGGLDKVLEKSLVVNLNKNLESNMSFSDHDKKNSCLYTPPVAPACSVNPSGKSNENTTKGLSSNSCLALERFMKKYPDRKAFRDNTYPKIEDYLMTFQKVKLDPLLCKNAFPSEDDSKDCKWGTSGSGSSGSRVSDQ